MILVDVECPELGKTIDFQLDENVYGWDIAEEIAGMVARTCSRSFQSGEQTIFLYSVQRQCRLDLNKTLSQNGVTSGERLLFI
ncbi:MAG: hypothetical protein IJO28_05470 [Oscillospiraceae bacterium]|nr:hypothetical protein [Oscillospiraceae bacterium]